MTEDGEIETRIEQILRCRRWHGVVPIETAITNAITYRTRLNGVHRRMFDDAMREGLLPERAIEMLDYAVEHGLIPAEENELALVSHSH